MHRPGADRGAERAVGRGGHELPNLRRLLVEGGAPAAHPAELARGRFVVDVRVGNGARPARLQTGGAPGNAPRETAQGRLGLAAGERVGRQADGRVAAGCGPVADAVTREDAGVERPRARAVLGCVGVTTPDEEPRVHCVRPRQGDCRDAQAVGERSRADGDAAAVDPGTLGARDDDRHPEDLAHARLPAHGHGHERIRNRAGESVLDGVRGRGHRHRTLAQNAHGARQAGAVLPEQAPSPGADLAAAVDHELERGPAAPRGDERRLPGREPGRLLELDVRTSGPDHSAGRVPTRPAAGARRHSREGGDREEREGHAEQRAPAPCTPCPAAITHLLSQLDASYPVAIRALA